MTTFQLIIVCFTVLSLAAIVAVALLLLRLVGNERVEELEAELVDDVVAPMLASIAGLAAEVRALARELVEEDEAEPPRIGHRVTVHTKQPDDQTIFGALIGDYEDRIVLEDAEYVTPSGGTPISGRQHIATRDIAWIDVHANVAPLPSGVPAE